MSIKSELRLIEQQEVPIKNGTFLKNTDGWVGTGSTTDWIHGSFNNTIRKIIGTTTKLSQELSDFNGTEVSTTYTEGAEAYKLDFTIFGQQSGFTFTPVLGGVSGTTITENGIYHQIFYITPDEPIENSRFILINSTDYIVINDAGDALIWE